MAGIFIIWNIPQDWLWMAFWNTGILWWWFVSPLDLWALWRLFHTKILEITWVSPGSPGSRRQETDQGQCGGALRGLQDVDTCAFRNIGISPNVTVMNGQSWEFMEILGIIYGILMDFMVVNSKFTNKILTNYLEFTLRWFQREGYGSHGQNADFP